MANESSKRRGWRWDNDNSELEAEVNGTKTLGMTATAATLSGTLAVTGAVTHSGGTTTTGVDYSGRGAVTQATNHSTGVTLNAESGIITLASTDLAAGAEAQFTVTNSTVAVGDVVVACVGTNNDASGTPMVSVLDVAAGSFDILLTNLHATTAAFNDASTINFAVIGSNA